MFFYLGHVSLSLHVGCSPVFIPIYYIYLELLHLLVLVEWPNIIGVWWGTVSLVT